MFGKAPQRKYALPAQMGAWQKPEYLFFRVVFDEP
jgi:hypothetical protein